MINININTNNNNDIISPGSLNITDWLNSIEENKKDKSSKEKRWISRNKVFKSFVNNKILKKLPNNLGYIPIGKYKKKNYFELTKFDIENSKNKKITKTKYTPYITIKGQDKLLRIVLKMIKEEKEKK